ncbi:methyltransferase domain-containing protein [Pleurostoma richardsiae]|uniref:Methyltransferase domain-containing protein n=1 Tax=Pleurostoma richardsiae TaxID=41990 RepID=A0AA38RQW6_9PEZI|nr:methyltransferase domain-containing protein [Pleurostoma richardsiae]
MAESTAPVSASFSPEKTFRSYTSEQGAAYAQNRRGYHPNLYKLVVNHHTSTGGQLDTILDVGCGPGIATRALAPHFAHAIGLDPSEGMIVTARSLGGQTSGGEPIRFEVSSAEELGSQLDPPVHDSSVDLIVAATAAHWFDMSRFWPSAARVLKPGGTIALWTGSTMCVHASTPNHAAIQQAMEDFEERHLRQYIYHGNYLVRNMYVDLPLPWTLETPAEELDQDTFVRKEWNKGGACEEGEEFFMGQHTVDLDMLEKILGTGSPMTRWRQAHPDAAGTEQDVVRMIRREIEKLLHEAGVEKGKEVVTGGLGGVLLVVKKRA